MSWDGFQREVLAELGLAMYALADAAAVAASVADEAPPSPLLLALLRASAAKPGQDAALALCRDFLAANPAPTPAARRALWPRLRRLRARHA